jgi:putative MATE family efflux protein
LKELWHLFWTAVRGKEKNFTSGSIRKALFLLSVPIVLEMSMEALFAICDAFYVALLGNEEYLATIGLTETSLFIVISIALGISMAGTSLVARRIGEDKKEEAADAAFQTILIAVIFALLIGVLGFFYAADLLRLMGGSEELIAQGKDYTRIMITFNIVLMLLFAINAIFRGAGDADIAMRTLILANGLNIVLDPCLIFGLGPFPELGFKGAAIATCTGRGIGVCYQIYHLLNGKSLIHLTMKNVKILWGVVRRLLILTGGSAGQHLITSTSWFFMVMIVASFGSEVIAAYTIAFRIIAFTILPAWGIAMASATLVGQNLGAGKPDRAEQSAWKAAYYNMLFLLFISVVFIIFADPVIRLFSTNEDVVRNGVLALRIILAGYVFYAYEMVLGQSFNGAGDTYTPTFLNFIAFWLIQVPLSCVLAHFTPALMAIYVFRLGRWKNIQI